MWENSESRGGKMGCTSKEKEPLIHPRKGKDKERVENPGQSHHQNPQGRLMFLEEVIAELILKDDWSLTG